LHRISFWPSFTVCSFVRSPRATDHPLFSMSHKSIHDRGPWYWQDIGRYLPKNSGNNNGTHAAPPRDEIPWGSSPHHCVLALGSHPGNDPLYRPVEWRTLRVFGICRNMFPLEWAPIHSPSHPKSFHHVCGRERNSNFLKGYILPELRSCYNQNRGAPDR